MKIGIVGYQGSGKSTLFEWLTGVTPDLSLSHSTQSAMATVPDARVQQLCEIYNPKKVTQASLEMTDTPGLSRTHEGSAQKLAHIREAGCLVIVAAAYGGADAKADLQNFEDDLLIADLDIVVKRIERLRDEVKRPKKNRDELQAELEALEPLVEPMENGVSIREIELTDKQIKATKAFQLLSQKPRFIIINCGDDESNPDRFIELAPEGRVAVVPLSLQNELDSMEEAERAEFCEEMEVSAHNRDQLLLDLMNASHQMLFFTAGEKEVRTWMIPQQATAVDAAGAIHTDLARGFIRAAVMSIEDLVRLGSEREVKAENLMRQEPKDYVIQDGDVIEIRHN